jgi:CopA family copper-resistance protein
MKKNPSAAERRRFLKLLGSAGAMALLSPFMPAWARPMNVGTQRLPPEGEPQIFNLDIRQQSLAIAGGTGNAVTIDGGIPGPLLEWQEGREVILNVTNHMRDSTSIHWHGILLPFEMDGVPGVTFKGIDPGTTFQYRFPVRQSGTYWYHSHSGLQEQSGAYGPLVIQPRAADPVAYDRDYVVMLSDWTFEDPHKVLRNLKGMSDYYNFQQVTVAEMLAANDGMSFAEATRMKLAWDRMRMMPSDIADVTGATYSYLMNGAHPAANWTGLFKPGERVRLRFINAAAMTYFNVRIPGLPLTVVAADGQNVQPVTTDEFQIGVAETYDVIVQPSADQAFTIMAESMDRSGFAAGTLAPRQGMQAAVPPLRKPPRLTMTDMGMDMSAMNMPGMEDKQVAAMPGMPAMDHAKMSGVDHSKMSGMAGMDHSQMKGMGGIGDMEGMDGMSASVGPVTAKHGPDTHGIGNISVADVQRDRLGEPGTGLESEPHRVLVYNDLLRLADDFDPRPPEREIELHLTGHMERYMWSFDGKQFHEVDGPIEFRHNERLRLILVNDTMMNHPIHLHGMWMELENGHGEHIPLKHTINLKPAARVSALITPIDKGRWAFHCHLLYHMEMGMFRVVRVS